MGGTLVLLISLAGAGTGAWIVYFRWKDKRRPEPLRLILLTTAAGVVSVGAASFGYGLLDNAGRAPTWEAMGGGWGIALGTALAIGFVEELAKFIPVLLVAQLTTHFDELWDGPVYAAAAAAGFALAETLAFVWTGEIGTTDAVARAVAAPITHALFAAPAGLGLAYAVLERRYWALGAGFAASVACHGFYDLFLAREGLHLAAAGLVGAVWMWLLWVARDLVRRPAVVRE